MPLLHALLAVAATAVTWVLSGILIRATERIAKRYRKPGFFVAFFVLGLLTSVSEMSAALNASLRGVPQVSAGNLVGASLVIFLLIIPLLAVCANGIDMRLTLKRRDLRLLLFTVLLPALVVLDGRVDPTEGILLVLSYGMLAVGIRRNAEPADVRPLAASGNARMARRRATLRDLGKILAAGILIFFAGKILVDEAVFFSLYFKVPPSFVGLLLLSVGTNVPELTIALHCLLGKNNHVAFGDYLGSAAANTLILGVLSFGNGAFLLERSEFIPTFLLLLPGLVLFYLFSQSKSVLSRREGIILLLLYTLFLLCQLFNVAQIIPTVQGMVGGA